jgi:RNAse (barnase) inhibitor barstar
VNNKTGEWRMLRVDERVYWLERARREFHDVGPRTKHQRGTIFTIDGNDFDDLTGFLCAMGESVNGPGGYFGHDLQSFDDCLFGGFGLEAPCTIHWLASSRSRALLDAVTLEKLTAIQIASIDSDPDSELLAEGKAELLNMAEMARTGEITLFDVIVNLMRSAQARHLGRNDWAIDVALK